jgi:hypothetical protein
MKRKSLALINHDNPDKPKLDFVALRSFLSDLRDFKHGKKVWVEISDYSPKRSLAQNSLFHLWCEEISQECGQDLDDVKSTLKTMFAQYPLLDKSGEEQFNPATGEKLMFVKDTSAMSKTEMGDLMEKTQLFALEFWGMILTNEGEQKPLKFDENY